ncbi:MAG TPA: 16S rRNA (adenine(1518)-N(6)/adenine(1519)-N(6))-dimethyltransferase RsmA [Limnochordales bacterium]
MTERRHPEKGNVGHRNVEDSPTERWYAQHEHPELEHAEQGYAEQGHTEQGYAEHGHAADPLPVDPHQLPTPSGVAAVLRHLGLSPRKALGQNFLVDRNIVAKILDAAQLTPEDTVLEIGPGLGVLTWELARRARAVVAVELDAGLMRWLRELFAGQANVRLVHGDALTVDLAGLLAAHPPGPGGSAKVLANLPYYITSPLLMRLLEEELPISLAVVMVQKEVARRLLARPGTKDYGALSVAVQLRAQVEIVAPVPPGVFFPPPEVESAVVRLTLRPLPEEVEDAAFFSAVVRAAFAQRRKMLRNALQSGAGLWDKDAVPAALADAGIDGGRRGETLSVAEFVRLSAVLRRFPAQPETSNNR